MPDDTQKPDSTARKNSLDCIFKSTVNGFEITHGDRVGSPQ